MPQVCPVPASTWRKTRALAAVASEARQASRKGGLDQAGVRRATPVVNQAYYGAHSQLTKPAQPLVGPGPVDLIFVLRSARYELLPQHRIAQSANTEPGEEIDVVEALEVTVPLHLPVVGVVDAIDRALEPTPHLQRGGSRSRG